MRNSRAARRARCRARRGARPQRGLRESAESLEIADTADNRRHLAEERMKRGQWKEAEALYRAALVGPLADDPALLIGLAKALAGAGDHQGALDAIDTLYRASPDYESREARLIQAERSRASAARGGRRRLARADRLHDRPGGAGALWLMMKKVGEVERAREAFAEAVRTYGRSRGKLDAEREWLAEPRANRVISA
jgi:hypothetical protein